MTINHWGTFPRKKKWDVTKSTDLIPPRFEGQRGRPMREQHCFRQSCGWNRVGDQKWNETLERQRYRPWCPSKWGWRRRPLKQRHPSEHAQWHFLPYHVLEHKYLQWHHKHISLLYCCFPWCCAAVHMVLLFYYPHYLSKHTCVTKLICCSHSGGNRRLF